MEVEVVEWRQSSGDWGRRKEETERQRQRDSEREKRGFKAGQPTGNLAEEGGDRTLTTSTRLRA